MKNNIKISTPIENNVIMVTNNNVKYYENLANQYAKESAKSAVKSAFSANEAKEYLNACENLKNTIDTETMQLVSQHSENSDNPHSVTSSQVGAYSKEEIDNLLIQELSKKNTLLVSGENINIVDNEDGTQTISSFNTFVLDYLLTENKPSLNSVILEGNKFAHDFGLANLSDLPLSVSDLENDVGYLTQHQDISGKADKSTTLEGYGIRDAYTKDEVDSIFFSYIGDIQTLLSEV